MNPNGLAMLFDKHGNIKKQGGLLETKSCMDLLLLERTQAKPPN
jgi:hypothetical protein